MPELQSVWVFILRFFYHFSLFPFLLIQFFYSTFLFFQICYFELAENEIASSLPLMKMRFLVVYVLNKEFSLWFLTYFVCFIIIILFILFFYSVSVLLAIFCHAILHMYVVIFCSQLLSSTVDY